MGKFILFSLACRLLNLVVLNCLLEIHSYDDNDLIYILFISFQVGDENGKANTAPMKMKIQFMLQVPQDDIKSTVILFRVKKRWDILLLSHATLLFLLAMVFGHLFM